MRKTLNGLNITYRYHKGNSNVVLLLHGWGGSLNSFKHLENYLIKNNYSVITLDFPGFGGSDLPDKNWKLDDYVKIIEELLNAEHLKKINIVSHSFGGRVAISFASKHKNLTNKLVLVDSAGIKPKFNLFKSFKILRYKFLKKLVKAKIIKRDLSGFGSRDYKAMPEELRPVFNKIVNQDLTNNAKQIDSPTLIIWGKDDKDTPMYMAKKLHKCIKDSAIITLEGGHFAYLNNADKFSIIVNEFLK